MDPKEFFRLAENLARSSDEVSLRTAVSRAYYSCFLQARDILGLSGRKRRIHRYVIDNLKKKNRAAGDQLEKLEDLRGTADYKMIVEDPLERNWVSNWELASHYTSHILERLERLRS